MTEQDLLRNAAFLRRLARRLVNDESAAEDYVQETWAAALKVGPRGEGPLLPWLATVLRNFVRMDGRRRRMQSERVEDVAAAAGPTAARSPEVLLERLEAKRLLVEELAKLPDPFRTTVLLRYVEDLSAAGIARMQRVPAGTVRWRLKRGLELLRERLDARTGGRRRSWVIAFLPLSRGEGDALAALGGAFIMGTKAKLGIGTAVALVAAALLYLSLGGRSGSEARDALGAGDRTGHVGRSMWPTLDAPDRIGHHGAIAGVVLDPDGAPVPGAAVTLSRAVGSMAADTSDVPRPAAAGVSDAGGRFRFEHLLPGAYTLTAMKSRARLAPALSEAAEVASGQTREVRMILGRGGLFLTGRVRDSGAGVVAGARVTAALTERDGEPGAAVPFWSAISGHDGAFSVVLLPGRYAVRAEADGYAVATEIVIVEADIERDIRLEPGASVAGRVVDRVTRTPIAGANVQARNVEGWRSGRSRVLFTESDGTFRLDGLGPGDFVVEVHESRRVGRSVRIRLVPGESRTDVTVELDAGLSISGRVTGPDGRGVAAAHVTASLHVGGSPLETSSSPDGSFRFDGLLPGRYGLVAVTRQAARAQKWTNVDADITGFGLTLQPGVVVRGQVVSAAGAPIAGARVMAATEPADAGWIGRTTPSVTSGPDGRFQLHGLEAGRVAVRAEKSDEGSAQWTEKLPAGSVREVLLRLESGASLAGIVRFPDGAPAPGAVVYAAYSRLNSFVTGQDPERLAPRAVAGPDGRYHLRGLAAGSPRVSATRSGGPVQTRAGAVPVPLGEGEHKTLDLIVPRGETIRGRVVLPDGEPAAGALVVADADARRPLTVPRLRAIADGDGTFVIDELDSGESYAVWAGLTGYADAQVTGVAAGRRELRLELARESSVAGVVVDESGHAVSAFEVQLGPAGVSPRYGRPGGDWVETIRDPAGRFEVRSLAAGSYTLQVRTLRKQGAAATFTLATGDRKRDLRVALQGPLTIRGRVVDHETNVAIAGVGVKITLGNIDLPYGGIGTEVKTDAAGAFVFENVWRHSNFAFQIEPRQLPYDGQWQRTTIPPEAKDLDLGAVRLLRTAVRAPLR